MVPILFRAQILHKKLAVWHMSFWTHQPSFTGVNSLAPGNFKSVIFKLMSMIDILRTSCEIALMRMPQIHIGDKSVLVQVMVWCRQATSHYQSQCWPRSLSPYGTTGPQWVKLHSHYVRLSVRFHVSIGLCVWTTMQCSDKISSHISLQFSAIRFLSYWFRSFCRPWETEMDIWFYLNLAYCQNSNTSCTLVSKRFVDLRCSWSIACCLSALLQLHLHSQLNTWLQ